MEKKTYKYQDTFAKLSSNMISYLYQFFTPQEMIKFGKLGKRFARALSSDFLWESMAKNDALFLPEESSQFKSWKDYNQFLIGLKNSLITGKLTKKFGVKTFRGHSKVVENVVSIPMANGPFNIVLSGDEDGKVYAWDLEKDEDDEDYYKFYTVLDAQCKIQGMRYYEKQTKLLIWNRKNRFYLFDVDNLYTPNSKKKNYERFTKTHEFQCDVESGQTMTDVEIDFNDMDIYMCGSFLDSSKLAVDHKIYSYHVNNGQSICDFNLTSTSMLERRVAEERVTNIYKDFSHISDPNTFVITPLSLVVGCSYDTKKFVMTNLYQDSVNIPNLYEFDKRLGSVGTKLHINLDYIFNLFLYIKNDEINIVISGVYNDQAMIVICNQTRIGLGIKDSITLSNLVMKPYNIKMSHFNYEKPGVTFLINGTDIISLDLSAKKLTPKVKLEIMNDNTSQRRKNCTFLDRYRVIEAYDNLHIKIYSTQTGKFWFYFIGGSMTVTPRSFVKHPNYDGFHLIVPTRYSIIGVMGNLVREYVFQPKLKV